MKIKLQSSKLDCFSRLDEIVCPYCGHKIKNDLHSYFGDEVEDMNFIACPECELEFEAFRNVTYFFSTYPLDKTKNIENFDKGDICTLRGKFDKEAAIGLMDVGIELANKLSI